MQFPAVFPLSVHIAIKVNYLLLRTRTNGKNVRIFKDWQNKTMKKDVKCYLGMDVSKLWVDITLMRVVDHHKQPTTTERLDNTEAGIKAMDKWLRKKRVPFDDNSLLVVENTGVYHRLIWGYCSTHGLPLHIGNATHIKHSFGIARGKNDKLDSQRLCSYAFKNAEELKATPALNPVLFNSKTC
jgi:transposase